jgi:hypothetical protein
MKTKDIQIGGRYVAKMSGRETVVRVDAIRDRLAFGGRWTTVFDVTNLSTRRRTTFRSAARFRRPETAYQRSLFNPTI